jgi:hypothetical protein
MNIGSECVCDTNKSKRQEERHHLEHIGEESGV